jgi:hypothetical protein
MGWSPPERTPVFNPVAFLLVAGGAASVTVGLTVGPWFSGSRDSTVSAIHRSMTTGLIGSGPAISEAFFSWVGWALLVAVFVLGVLGVCPIEGAASTALRLTAFTVAIAAVVISLAAIVKYVGWLLDLLANFPTEDSTLPTTTDSPARIILSHGGSGLWLTLFGYVAIGVGGLLGPLAQ